MRHGKITFDGTDTEYSAVIDDGNWNGWAIAWVSPAVLADIEYDMRSDGAHNPADYVNLPFAHGMFRLCGFACYESEAK